MHLWRGEKAILLGTDGWQVCSNVIRCYLCVLLCPFLTDHQQRQWIIKSTRGNLSPVARAKVWGGALFMVPLKLSCIEYWRKKNQPQYSMPWVEFMDSEGALLSSVVYISRCMCVW